MIAHYLPTIAMNIKRLLNAATADSSFRCLAVLMVNVHTHLPCERHCGGVDVCKRNDFPYIPISEYINLTASYQVRKYILLEEFHIKTILQVNTENFSD